MATPTVKATKATGGATKTTKKYVVKSGDSLSSIAVALQHEHGRAPGHEPDLSGSTLVVGQRIVVPAQ